MRPELIRRPDGRLHHHHHHQKYLIVIVIVIVIMIEGGAYRTGEASTTLAATCASGPQSSIQSKLAKHTNND